MAGIDSLNSESGEVRYAVHASIAVITLCRPKKRNALGVEHLWALEEALGRSARDHRCTATVLAAQGAYFSAGGDFREAAALATFAVNSSEAGEPDLEARRRLAGEFFGKNSMLAATFWSHPKPLIVALNGPAIGLAAALVVLADLIVARQDKAALLFPFAQLALVSEGAAAAVLPIKVGYPLAARAILASEPIRFHELEQVGFFAKLLPASLADSDFISEVVAWAQDRFGNMEQTSVAELKRELRMPFNAAVQAATHDEASTGIERFARGIPQKRFMEFTFSRSKHRL